MNKPTLLQVLWSVLAGFFGVQTPEGYERDANAKSAIPYIVVGTLCTIALVLIIWFVVQGIMADYEAEKAAKQAAVTQPIAQPDSKPTKPTP